MTTSSGRTEGGNWTVGADTVERRDWSGEAVEMPAGELHAVSGEGLIAGRAICEAPIRLLDPRDWWWPGDGAADWPLCRTCLVLAG